ncbi:MAG: 30S ribosomal protein S20 [Candidatus Paceibacterota bacterium]|jgi:ribosomal protein S20
MPRIASAKKALRQNITRRATNSDRKVALKKAAKAVRKLTSQSSSEDIARVLSALYTTADKVAKTKYIKKTKAARIKSRATKFITTLRARS